MITALQTDSEVQHHGTIHMPEFECDAVGLQLQEMLKLPSQTVKAMQQWDTDKLDEVWWLRLGVFWLTVDCRCSNQWNSQTGAGPLTSTGPSTLESSSYFASPFVRDLERKFKHLPTSTAILYSY